MKKRFGVDSFNMRVLKKKCNKKCRDVHRAMKLRCIESSKGAHSEVDKAKAAERSSGEEDSEDCEEESDQDESALDDSDEKGDLRAE